MSKMFSDASAFNQDLSGWHIAKHREGMFDGSGMSEENLSTLNLPDDSDKSHASNMSNQRNIFWLPEFSGRW
jgi:hypothetical protein